MEMDFYCKYIRFPDSLDEWLNLQLPPQIEGTITCALGFAAYMAIVDFPELSPKSWRFLNHREAAFVVARIEHDRADVKTEPFVLGAYLRNALDSKVWAFAALYMFTTTSVVPSFLCHFSWNYPFQFMHS